MNPTSTIEKRISVKYVRYGESSLGHGRPSYVFLHTLSSLTVRLNLRSKDTLMAILTYYYVITRSSIATCYVRI